MWPEAHLCCEKADGAELISGSHGGVSIRLCTRVFVCMHETIPAGACKKNNSHSLLRYNLMHLCFHQRAPTGCAHLRDLISISASRRFIRKTVNRAVADQFMMLSGSEQPATCALKTRFLYLIVPSYVASVSISMVTFHSRNPHCTSWGTC